MSNGICADTQWRRARAGGPPKTPISTAMALYVKLKKDSVPGLAKLAFSTTPSSSRGLGSIIVAVIDQHQDIVILEYTRCTSHTFLKNPT